MRRPPVQTDIVDLEIDEAVRPHWVKPRMRLRVPFPGAARDIDGEAVAFGRWPDGRRRPVVGRHPGGWSVAAPWEDWVEFVRYERYATRRRPLHTRLPFGYHCVPNGLRHRIATLMYQDRDAGNAFPIAPFEPGFEALRAVVEGTCDGCNIPSGRGLVARVCLTHDVDTAEGFAWVRPIAQVELSLGLRSSWNIVADEYSVDYDTLDWLVERGFEIGLHDLRHDNRLIYLSESHMRFRLDRCRSFIERYAVTGFRSPSWLRNELLYHVLPDYVRYDTSSLDFDWLCPAGRCGVLSPNPFSVGRLAEIPATLPWEAPLLTGARVEQLNAYWRPKVDWLAAVGGQAVVNTHPDPHYSGSPAAIREYARFLESLLHRYAARWSLPRDLASEVADA